MSLLFCCGARFCFFGSLFVMLIFYFFFTHLRTKIKFHLGIAPGLWDFQNQY